jgi:hypothetical protein
MTISVITGLRKPQSVALVSRKMWRMRRYFLAQKESQFISGLGLNVDGGAIVKF